MENIRDRGNSERRAQQVQDVVGLLGQVSALPVIEKPEASQLGYTMHEGWNSEGNYITPEH